MKAASPEAQAYFRQSREGYRPGKHAVWDAGAQRWMPGRQSSAREWADYRAWREGKRTPSQERASIMDRMLAAEFGFKPHTSRPVTVPSAWSYVLGEPLPDKYLTKAAAAWEAES